jgi:quercetin dioxygenase-like cupin family protein
VKRVLLTTGLVVACSMSWAQGAGPMTTVVDPATAKFEPVPDVPPCMKGSVLRGDPGKGESVLLARGTAGCAIPFHWHTPNEQLEMVSGTARVSMKDAKPAILKPGGYAHLPSKHQHAFTCSTACTFFVASAAAFDILDGLPRRLLDPDPRQDAPHPISPWLGLAVEPDRPDVLQLGPDGARTGTEVARVALRLSGGGERALRSEALPLERDGHGAQAGHTIRHDAGVSRRGVTSVAISRLMAARGRCRGPGESRPRRV